MCHVLDEPIEYHAGTGYCDCGRYVEWDGSGYRDSSGSLECD